MNRIESGPTGERVVRGLIYILFFGAFSLYFAYDGYIGYPKENLKVFVQRLPQPAQGQPITYDARVTKKNIAERVAPLLEQKRSLRREELVAILGEPAYEDKDTKPGVERLYFIGPAVRLDVELAGGQLLWPVGPNQWDFSESVNRSEASLATQKLLAVLVGLATIVLIVHLFRVLTTRVALDDDGLNYNGKLIPWDRMTGLDAERYRTKGYVTLEYLDGDATRSLRFDSYHVKAFKEILTAICDRKGFANPLARPAEAAEADSTPAE